MQPSGTNRREQIQEISKGAVVKMMMVLYEHVTCDSMKGRQKIQDCGCSKCCYDKAAFLANIATSERVYGEDAEVENMETSFLFPISLLVQDFSH